MLHFKLALSYFYALFLAAAEEAADLAQESSLRGVLLLLLDLVVERWVLQEAVALFKPRLPR